MADKKYPHYRLYKDSRSEWRWTYYAKNAEEIGVSSEGYKNKADCTHAISLINTSSNDPTYED